MVGVGTGEEGMEDMGTAEEGMRAGMEEAMAEGGTMEENMVEVYMVEVTAEEAWRRVRRRRVRRRVRRRRGEEATAEVDMGVEYGERWNHSLWWPPRRRGLPYTTSKGFRRAYRIRGNARGDPWCGRPARYVRKIRPLTHLILHSMMLTCPYSQRPSR
jgi:hypothetical protein